MHNYLGGQLCISSVDIQQNGDDEIENNRIAIIPNLNFTCNGRITTIRARVRRPAGNTPSFFQIWRPSSTSSTVYNRIGEVQLSDDQVIGSSEYQTANIILTGSDKIEVQSGDVVGYYREFFARYRLRTIQTDGYILYEFDGSRAPTSVDLNNANRHMNERQPLIEYIIGKCVFNHSSLLNKL